MDTVNGYGDILHMGMASAFLCEVSQCIGDFSSLDTRLYSLKSL
jgi:hypothetical protein